MAESVQSQNPDIRKSLTQEELRRVLSFDPATGEFRWLRSFRGQRRIEAGSPDRLGYREIRYLGKMFKAHRLAWLYVHGEWPTGEIDHIDRDPSNNRISNLREATRSQQNANTKCKSNNASGFKGVVQYRKRFAAYIKARGRNKYLGMFDTPEAAHAAYMEEAVKEFGEFARAS